MRRESNGEPSVPSCHRLFPSSDRDQDPAGLPVKAQGHTASRTAKTSRKKVIDPPHSPPTFSYREFQKHGENRLNSCHTVPVPIPQLPQASAPSLPSSVCVCVCMDACAYVCRAHGQGLRWVSLSLSTQFLRQCLTLNLGLTAQLD